MGDVCRLSWQPSERRAIRRVFSFSPPLVWLTARDSLSVWTVSLKDERHYHERTQAVQGVHAPVLTATWQTVLSGAVRGSTFETCNFFFFLRDCYLSLIYGSNFQRRIGRTGRSQPLLSSVWHHRVG